MTARVYMLPPSQRALTRSHDDLPANDDQYRAGYLAGWRMGVWVGVFWATVGAAIAAAALQSGVL